MRFDPLVLGPITDLGSGESWDAARLCAAAARTASVLSPLLAGGRRHVVIAHGGGPAFFADLFGVWRAGGCAVCVNPQLTPGELETIVGFVRPAAILVGAGAAPAPDGGDVPMLCTARAAEPDNAAPGPGIAAALDDPALVLFTSGTTGDPKGVVHSFRSLFARIALNRAFIGDDVLARALCVLPTHFGHGLIGNCLTPLFAGGSLLLHGDTGPRGIAALGGLLEDHGVTFMSSVPAFWRMALRFAKPPGRATLRRVQIGSAPLSAALWGDVMAWSGAETVVNMYGITETANWAAGASTADHAPEDGLIGTMWGGAACVLSESGARLAVGEGEILLQTPSLMTGYHERADLTAAVIRDGWFHTGDTGSVDPDGILRLTGRRKSEINKGGVKVQPEEVDLLLERHESILEACCFGAPDPVSGECVGAAIVLAPDAGDLTNGELRAWCQARIKPECVPDKWFRLDAIPRSDRGKVNRDRVRDHCLGDNA
jgi:acyl-CoA synthetase (AMP-forming)/AMP-acid ligase II